MKIPPSMDDQFLSKVLKQIEDNLDNECFSVEDLAKSVALSRSMLHRKLTKLTGKSASNLITEIRLIKAKELLENDVATASEVSYKVGFNSPSYFNKVFKNYYHVSPGEVRKGAKLVHHSQPPDPSTVILYTARKKIVRFLLISMIVLLALAGSGTAIYYIFRNNKPVEKSIAILPFDNLSSNSENQYFADGIVEDLLNRISKIEGLKVISRTSSEMFRNKGSKTIPEIAKLLGVRYILEGTVQRQNDDVRINIQLIDAKKDDHILSKQFDRKLNEVFAIQSEIASQVVSELSAVLPDKQYRLLRQNRTNNVKAFEYYQMGRFHSSKRLIDGYKKGNEYYEKAISEDPEYALAYAGLSDNFHLMALQKWIDLEIGKNRALELAKKAMELDPNLAEPHVVLGDLYACADWNWEMAEKELQLAIKLNPNFSTAHQYYSELLAITGRPDKAREHINKALELDPLSFIIRFISCLNYYSHEQYLEALAENNVCHELVKDHQWAVRLDFDIYYQLDMKKEALESFKHYGNLFNYYNPAKADSIFENEGMDGLLRVKIKTESSQALVAYWHVLLGEFDKAMEILEKQSLEGKVSSLYLPQLENSRIRNDPRFAVYLDKLGLLHYQGRNNP
jgi:TolB-like protein/AraC-like DNA-binding protein